MKRTYYIIAPDGETKLTRTSSRPFNWVALVKVEGKWGWVRWSETYEGAEKALAGWTKLPTLEQTYIGVCRHEESE